jgi:hypothetical protein
MKWTKDDSVSSSGESSIDVPQDPRRTTAYRDPDKQQPTPRLRRATFQRNYIDIA